ncbi:MAG TPA: glycerol-3-phosphate acyltransferase [Dehalococcoidia bacterium]|nr:glycerol-3-phosphate acyltransferase [Dehalococcoidia bacterium]
MLLDFSAVVIGYLLGSIPAAYVIARLQKGIDIRDVGSRNMGAANVFREVSPLAGIAVWAIDVAKGSATILIAQALCTSEPWVLIAGFAAMLGHNFPVYIGFRGGRGAATTMGIFLVLAPVAMAITFALLAIPYYFLRRIFIAMCIVGPVFPILIWQLEHSVVLAAYSLVLLFFMAIRNLPRPQEIPQLLAKVKEKYRSDRYLED